jgi:hypothetical protein
VFGEEQDGKMLAVLFFQSIGLVAVDLGFLRGRVGWRVGGEVGSAERGWACGRGRSRILRLFGWWREFGGGSS